MSDNLWNYQARFIRAIDGDTIEVDIDLGFDITMRKSVRIAGVNTPERGEAGYVAAKEFVQQLFSRATGDFPLRLQTIKTKEKYGRYLAKIDGSFIDDAVTDIGSYIVEKGYGKEYHGGAR